MRSRNILLKDINGQFQAYQSRSYERAVRMLRGGGEKRGEKTARQCRQLEKRRNSWSVSDIIVVVGVSGVGRRGTGRKEGGWDQTHAEESRCRSHMHRDDDDDTIWSFAPEACDNITVTCYVLHGRRHAWELLTPTQKNATTDTSGKPVASAHVSKQEDRWVVVWGYAHRGGWGKGWRYISRSGRIGACSAGAFSVFGFVGFVGFLRRMSPLSFPDSYRHSRLPLFLPDFLRLSFLHLRELDTLEIFSEIPPCDIFSV